MLLFITDPCSIILSWNPAGEPLPVCSHYSGVGIDGATQKVLTLLTMRQLLVRLLRGAECSMMKQEESEKIFKKYLRLKGYTQGRLARELHVDPSTINKWIKGINAIPYETVDKLCALLALEGRERAEFFEAAGYPLPSTRPASSPRSSSIVEDLPPGYVLRP